MKYSLRIIGVGCIVLFIASLFLPYINYGGISSTLFDGNKELYYLPCILIGLSLISLVVLLLNKKIELVYLLIGSGLTVAITNTIQFKDGFELFSFGYYIFDVSIIALFVLMLFSGNVQKKIVMSSNETKESNQKVDITNTDSQNLVNEQPNEFAQSIMNQPVMNNLSISDLNSSSTSNIDNNNVSNIVDTNTNIDNNSDINVDNSLSIDDNISGEINGEEIKLAPQNPLNSFLPADFDPSSINKNNESKLNDENVDNNSEKEVNDDDNKKDNIDSGQSILSVMSQPMVSTQGGAELLSNVGSANLNSSIDVNLNSEIVQPNLLEPETSNSTNVEPVVEPTINNQNVSGIVEPQVNNPINIEPVVEPTINNQNVSGIVEPQVNNPTIIEHVVDPTINNQAVVQSEIVEPQLDNQVVLESPVGNNQPILNVEQGNNSNENPIMFS